MPLAAIGQVRSTANVSHNLRQCQTLIRKAASLKASALFLPEASDWISSGPEESLSLVRPVEDSEFVKGVQQEAKAARLPVSVGVHEPGDGMRAGINGEHNHVNGEQRQRVKNTLLWIDEDGTITQRYQKVHLFDIAIKDGVNMKESRSVESGSSILSPFQTGLGRIGLMICFDLRFPEISLSLRRQGAELLTYPSAFTIPTGKDHWEPLLRARAIENQAYVIAAAQVGQHNEKRASYGHSMIIDPWGRILAELGGEAKDEPEIATTEIDLEQLNRIRSEVFLRRRTDVYPEV